MKKTTMLIVWALLCLNFCATAQNQATIKPLKLQEKTPDTIWNQKFSSINATGQTPSLSLNNYKGKLIILDFWASWCSSCLQQFPKLDSLQGRFKDAVQILLVNANIKGDTQAKMQARLKGYGLTSITFNDSLKQLFPYEFIPHYVWLDEEGKLLAITTANMVNEATIKGYLKTTIN